MVREEGLTQRTRRTQRERRVRRGDGARFEGELAREHGRNEGNAEARKTRRQRGREARRVDEARFMVEGRGVRELEGADGNAMETEGTK